MRLNRVNSAIDRTERNKLNENFDIIERGQSSIQTQLNTIVVKGDSSVEAAQARVNADNTVYSTLKERLDAENAQVNQQLAQIEVTPENFGAVDGMADYREPIQAAIDYALANGLTLAINKEYNVNPVEIDDGSMVCLRIYQNNQDNTTHGFGSSFKIKFNRGGKIKTSYTEECTLIRMKASNTVISDGYLEGVKGKTILLEMSRMNQLDNTEIDFVEYNNIRNMRFIGAKKGISMEGQCFYNNFENLVFLNNTMMIHLKESRYQETSGERNSNVNRNNFVNITGNLGNHDGIVLDYADTNRFVNVSFEALTGTCIILRDIGNKISNRWYTENNVFINTIIEACERHIYNDALASHFSHITYDHSKCEFIQTPKLITSMYDNNFAPSLQQSFSVNTEQTFLLDKKWSAVLSSVGGLFVRNIADFDSPTAVVEGTHNFTESQCTNINTLTFNSTLSLPYYKSIGRILHYLCRCSFKVTTPSDDIVLPLPRQPKGEYYSWTNVKNITKSVILEDTATGKYYTAYATIGATGITIKPPTQLSVVSGSLVETKVFPSTTLTLCMEIDYLIS